MKTKVDEKLEDILSRINADNPQSVFQVLREISPLLYKTKTMHSEVIKAILPSLDPANEEGFKQIWKLVSIVIRRKPESFDESAPSVLKILKMPNVKESLKISCYNDLAYNPKWLESEIDFLLKILKYGKNLYDRRSVIWTAGTLGSKDPEMVREFISVLIECIKSPESINSNQENKKDKEVIAEDDDLGISITMSVGGPDESVVLLADSIDAIGEIGSNNPEIVSDCIPALEEISKKTDGNYTIKKANEALEKIKRKEG